MPLTNVVTRSRLQAWCHFATGVVTRMRVEIRAAPVVLSVLLASIASQTHALEPYEVIKTVQTSYVTKDGIAWDARSAFQLKADTIATSMSEAVARGLALSVPIERPKVNTEPVWLKTYVGNQHATFHMSGVKPPPEENINISDKTLALLSVLGGAVIVLIHPPILIEYAAEGIIVSLGVLEPLHEGLNLRDKLSVPRNTYIVYRNGKMLPTWLNMILPEDTKDLATYVYNEIWTGRRSLVSAYFAKVLLKKFFASALLKVDLGPFTAYALGEFVESASDQKIRSLKSNSSSSSNPCISIFIGQSLSTSCFEVSLKPSLSAFSGAPSFQAPLVIPSTIQGIPIPVAAAQAVTQMFAAGAQEVTITTPEPNTIQVERPGGGGHDDNMKGLPIDIKITGEGGLIWKRR